MYDEFGKLAGAAASVIVLGIILYNFAIYVLPWLLLIGAIGIAAAMDLACLSSIVMRGRSDCMLPAVEPQHTR
jgi:hypothetical protein